MKPSPDLSTAGTKLVDLKKHARRIGMWNIDAQELEEGERLATPLVTDNANSPQQMALAAQLAKMARATKKAVDKNEDQK